MLRIVQLVYVFLQVRCTFVRYGLLHFRISFVIIIPTDTGKKIVNKNERKTNNVEHRNINR